jgi:hypothetical protein
MNYSRRAALFALSVFAAGWDGEAAANPTQTAEYTVTFEATWSAQTHPVDYPSNSHFSGLIGATHDASVSFWQLGGLASPGIESMAETGSKSPLLVEIGDEMTAGGADVLISGGGINPSPGSVSVSFQIDLDYPRVTLVSMIAPSPDWFVGVSDLSLLESGDWVEEKVVTIWPYDSGTDDGTTYSSYDQDTDPAEPITQIMTLPVGNGVPLGTFTFTRTDIPTAVEPGVAHPPMRPTLLQNSPNPFNPITTIRYLLPVGFEGPVRLTIYDARGRRVRRLVDGPGARSENVAVWNGQDDRGMAVPSGVYHYQLIAGQTTRSRQMVLAR